MLKECRSHGYFREEFCPHCGSEGKFLLNDEEVELLGRTMAGVLRHFPERYGLEIDANKARSSGVVIHKAGKTVYTSKEVPGEFLRRSHRVEEELPSEASADSTD